MTDDYQYTPTPLAPKNEGPFGLGGKPMEGSRGFSGSIVDSGPNFTIPPIEPFEFPSGLFQPGAQGPQGPQGATGPLLNGSFGDMIYHNGATWVGFGKPNTDGVLSIVGGTPNWITASTNGSLIYYDGNLNSWLTIPAPSGGATYVLAFKDNLLQWLETVDCGATGP